MVTYDSDLDKAMKICEESAKKVLKRFVECPVQKPYTRTYFQASGVNVHVRYFTPAKEKQQVSSEITQEIHKEIKKDKKVEIAFPHTRIVWDGKK
jgi:small-conductance mechanosensitive channel